MGTKDTSTHIKTLSTKRLYKTLIVGISNIRLSGLVKGRTLTLATISIKSELTYCQDFSTNILYRKIHLPCFILKDTQASHLVYNILQILILILRSYAKKHH